MSDPITLAHARSATELPAAPVSEEWRELVDRANTRVKDRATVVRYGFIQSLDPQSDVVAHPPLASFMQSPKSAAARLRFYLAVSWQAGGGDERHSTTWPAQAWAELINLPRPERNGARRILDSIRALEQAKLIATERAPGHPTKLVLLRDDGSGDAYTTPAASSRQAGKRALADFYVRIPSSFWTRGWALSLSAPGLAMLLVLLVITRNGSKHDAWVSQEQRRERFGISDDTWYRGVRELRRAGVIHTRKSRINEYFGEGRRIRHLYTVDVARLQQHPEGYAPPTED